MRAYYVLSAVAFLATCCVCLTAARAAEYTWTGAAGDHYWESTANWGDLADYPRSSDTAYLANGDTIGLDGKTESVYQFGNKANMAVGSLVNGTLQLCGSNLYFKEGTLSVNLAGSTTASRVFLGGNTTSTIVLSGDNSGLKYNDGTNVIIGHTNNGGLGGTVKLGSVNALSAGTANIYSGTIDFNGTSNVAASIGLNPWSSNATSGSASFVVNNASTDVTYGGNIFARNNNVSYLGGSGNLNLTGVLSNTTSGTMSFTKMGAGRMTFSGANTFGGTATISEGSLAISGSGTLGCGTATLQLANETTVDLGGTNQTVAKVGLANTPFVGSISNGTVTLGTGGYAYMKSGTLSAALAGSTTSRLCVGGGQAYLNGDNSHLVFTGSSTFVIGKTGWTGTGGTVTLGNKYALGSNSTYTEVRSGTIDFNGTNELATSMFKFAMSTADATDAYLVNSSATDVVYAGGIQVATAYTTSIGGSGNLELSGNITPSGTNAGGITKIGQGALTLSGTDTYTGATTVSAGTLLVNGSLANTSSVSVASSATLAGSGNIASQITVLEGGILAPGTFGSAGTLTVTGGLTLNDNAKLAFDLGGTTSSDKISMAVSTLTLTDLQFSDFSFTALSGFGIGTYTLIDANAISGSFVASSGLINGLEATLALSTSGDDLMLKVAAVPEPVSLTMLITGLIGMIAYAWRKKK